MFPEVGDVGVSLPGAGAAESARSPGGSRGARPGGLGTWAPAPRWPRARGRGRKGGPAFGRTDAAPGSARSRAPRVSRPRRPSLGPSPGRPRWQGKHLLSISRCVDAALPGPPVCLWGARASPRTRGAGAGRGARSGRCAPGAGLDRGSRRLLHLSRFHPYIPALRMLERELLPSPGVRAPPGPSGAF